MTDTGLRPCPFCGCEKIAYETCPSGGDDSGLCLGCGAIAFLPAWNTRTPPKVKPLEWIGSDFPEGVFWSATTDFGQYQVRESEVSGIYMQWDGFCIGVIGSGFGNSDAAKSAAQTDYERRVISALE